jgi:hypothetical protein
MRRQASLGDVDFITGDYLAGMNILKLFDFIKGSGSCMCSEVNLATNAEAHRSGHHPGYEVTAWDGLRDTIDLIAEKGIRVVINGGALNPRGLAEKVEALVSSGLLRVFRVTEIDG